MIKKIKGLILPALVFGFAALWVACGETAPKEEATQETATPAETPDEIDPIDTANIPIDTTAEQRPLNRR